MNRGFGVLINRLPPPVHPDLRIGKRGVAAVIVGAGTGCRLVVFLGKPIGRAIIITTATGTMSFR